MDSKLLILSIYSLFISASSNQPSNYNFQVFGPGLDPINIVHPARYFTIKADPKQSSLDDEVKLIFKAQGNAIDQNRPCRISYNLLDRKDGSYFARYKLYESCTNLQLELTLNGTHIANSPYKYHKAIILPETCNCPKQSTITKWLNINKCGNIPEQIEMDLQYFNNINWDELRSKVIDRFNKPDAISICHYNIRNNVIWRNCYGKHVGFKVFMDNILLSLTRKMIFPDMEFFVNLGDWPLVKENAVPVFSWCGSEDSYDIVMPTYDITEATLENMGRVTLDMLSIQSNTDFPWEKRIEKAFWRGRDSNAVRLKLIDIARSNPDLFNVSMTNFFFYRDKQDAYGPKTPHVSFYKFFDYKYQICIDGTVAAYRFPYLLGGGSLVLKQSSKYYEHFYHLLKPDVHYISLDRELDDLLSNINWALNHDEEAKQIGKNAQEFANDNLLPHDIFCYHAHLLNEFSKRIVSQGAPLDDMEEVLQPKESQNCHCYISNDKDEL